MNEWINHPMMKDMDPVKLELIKNAALTPKGTPAAKNPINNGMEEQEQNGVITPKNTAKK